MSVRFLLPILQPILLQPLRPFLRQSLPVLALAGLLCTDVAAAGANRQRPQAKLPPAVLQALQEARIPEAAMATVIQEVGSTADNKPGNKVDNKADSKAGNKADNRADNKATSKVTGKAPWLAVHATQPMQPASTIKLLTSYVALEQFGPAMRWKTSAYSNAALQNGVLQGDLVLQGGGDPKLVLESFWLFLRQLRAQGVRHIQGNLILDRSLFQASEFDAAAFDGDPARAYNVGPDALLLNFKSVRLRFEPDTASGVVRLQAEPTLAGISISAPALGNGDCVDWHKQLQFEWQGTQWRVNGSYPASCGIRHWALHPHGLSANQYVLALFQALWQELGGSLSGTVQDGTLPPDARLLAQWESPPLAELMRDMNKYSNNVMARHLLILLAASPNNAAPPSPAPPLTDAAPPSPAPPSTDAAPLPAPGLSAQAGSQVARDFLATRDLLDPHLVLENGAGLSRSEQISAMGLNRILLAAHASPWMAEFIASLPVVAHDGTMRRRLKESPVAGQAHIKTGTLTGVRSIAGFVRAQSGKIYAVTSIINHANADKAQAVHDELLSWLFFKG